MKSGMVFLLLLLLPKRLCFCFDSLVCLTFWEQDYRKTTGQIFMKDGGRKNSLNVEQDLNPGANTQNIFHQWRQPWRRSAPSSSALLDIISSLCLVRAVDSLTSTNIDV